MHNFIQTNLPYIMLAVTLLLVIGVLYGTFICEPQKPQAKDGTEFNIKRHRFGMAYTSAAHPKPFYPVNFIYMGSLCSCESIGAGGIKYIQPQWVEALRRAPEFDLTLPAAPRAGLMLTGTNDN